MGRKMKKSLIHRARHDIIIMHIGLDDFVFSDFS